MDELTSGRRLRDDLRQLKERYPELTTPAAQARLTAYMRTQIDEECIPTSRKESPMPAKDQRSFGEDLVPLTIRIPKSDMAFIDQHVFTLQRQHRYTRQGRGDAVRDLIQKGIDSIEHPPQQFPIALDAPQLPLPSRPPVEPAAVTAGGAIPPAPAYEARALIPEKVKSTRRRVLSPLDQAIEEMPLEHPLNNDFEDMPLAATVETARPKAAAKKRTTRTTKGR